MALGLFLKNKTKEMKMRKTIFILMIVLLCTAPVFSQAVEEKASVSETIQFTDSCGRTVEIPSRITKIAPSGGVATMMLAAIAPEYMCNVNSAPSASQMEYLPEVLATLPATGQLYGGKSTLNYEELIALGAEILIDMGDYKKGMAEDLDELQAQIGIPCIFLEADLNSMASAFRSLGLILEGKEERGEELAEFIDRVMWMAGDLSAKVTEEERLSVMYTSGTDGLGTNAKGSSQAQVIEIVGAENAIAVEKVSSKLGGNIVSLEQVYKADPDVILFTADSIYDSVASDPAWANLRAIREGRFYRIPGEPYTWMGNPPSMNMIMGILWLGNLLYPQYYDYDMTEATVQVFKVLWDCDITEAQAEKILGI